MNNFEEKSVFKNTRTAAPRKNILKFITASDNCSIFKIAWESVIVYTYSVCGIFLTIRGQDNNKKILFKSNRIIGN